MILKEDQTLTLVADDGKKMELKISNPHYHPDGYIYFSGENEDGIVNYYRVFPTEDTYESR
jgi:hypothetical protein